MTLSDALRLQAHANHLCNERLHASLAALPEAAFHAPRVGFFPSLAGTLNHLLAVDLYYVAALCGDADVGAVFARFQPAGCLAELRERQRAVDARLIAFCQGLDEAGCAAAVALPRRDHVQRDTVLSVLLHLFMHQHHHRGQAHGMLSATAVAPPQLDEFLMASEGHLREPDMARLGWTEAAVFGPTGLRAGA